MTIEVHHFFHHGAPETGLSPCCCSASSGEFKVNVLTILSSVLMKLEQVLTNQQEETRMSNDTHALVTRLTADVAASRTEIESAKTLLAGIPGLIKAAVDAALANNPSLTPEDLAAVTQVATELEAQTSELHTALETNGGAQAGGTETPQQTPE